MERLSYIIFFFFLFLTGFSQNTFQSINQETLALDDLLAISRTDFPAYGLTQQESLNLELSGGLGFHCGKFDPAVSISNTVNQVKDHVQNIAAHVMESATSAIIALPMYKLAQANPKLYNLLNHQLISAEEQFGIAMKTCNQMEQEALSGKNPYQEWVQVSRENTMARLQNQKGEKDLHQAFKKLEDLSGRDGIPWVKKSSSGQRGISSGGVGQTVIWVVHDIAEAGFEELYPPAGEDSQTLWPNATDAANWIVSVVGDQMITTCSGPDCPKGSKTPRGLYPDIETNKQKIMALLLEKIEHMPLGGFQDHAEKIDKLGVTPRLIEHLRHFDWHNQYRIVDLWSENLAMMQSIQKALLSKRILKAGAALPEAAVIGEVQKQTQLAISFLRQEVSDVLSTFEIKNKLFKSDVQNFFQLDQKLMQESLLSDPSFEDQKK